MGESDTKIIERAKRDPLMTLAVFAALGSGGGGLLSSNSVNAKLESLTISMAEVKGAVARSAETERSVGDIKAQIAKQDAEISALKDEIRRFERSQPK